MGLKERINNELITALKSKDVLKTEVLRSILSNIHNFEIEKKAKGENASLTEEEVLVILNREAKKKERSRCSFWGRGRDGPNS